MFPAMQSCVLAVPSLLVLPADCMALNAQLLPPHTAALQTYVLKQLRMNSDDVRLLRSYPAPWQVNLARPDNPSQVRLEWEQPLGQRQGMCRLQWEGQVGMVPQ